MAITFDPNDPLAVQQRSIERERETAQALLAQGLKSPSGGGQMAGRVFIPDYGSPLSDLANVFVGKHLAGKADEKEAVLADRRNERFAQILRRANEAETGTPGQAAVPGKGYGGSDIFRDDEGNLLPGATAEKPAVAAKPGSRREAAMILITSPDPTQRALGLKKLEDIKLGEGEVVRDVDGKVIAQGPDKTDPAVRGYELARAQGFTGSFIDYQTVLRKAGAPSSSITLSTAKDLSAHAGEIAKESRDKTVEAIKAADAANQILAAIPKAFTGTLADQKLQATQIGSTLGIPAGKQQLAATRVVIQNLAKLTLQGRKEMKGEGAITADESSLAERASSGEVSLTPTELTVLANAAKRASAYQILLHQNLISTMLNNKDTAGIVPFYDIPSIGAAPSADQQGGLTNKKSSRPGPVSNEEKNVLNQYGLPSR